MTRLQVSRPLRSSASGPTQRLDVHLPYGCGDNDPPVVTILTFDIDNISQQGFLSRVCATVGVEQAQAKLGWKTCDG